MSLSRSKITFHVLLFFALLASLLGSAVFVTPAYAAGITVNSSADTTADDGACTLREAIANAASDSQLFATAGECAAGSGSDTITFDSGLSGATIYLASTLDVLSNMTIDGSALTTQITISGDNNTDSDPDGDVRVFYIGSSVTATLNKLIITKAFSNASGGGVLNDGTLTIINSVFTENTVDNNAGGAIMNNTSGILTITDSTFSGNAAYDGGAIGNFNQMTIVNSTFSDNSSADSGGAIYTTGSVPALTQTITNSTFSGNSSSTNGFSGSGGAIFSSRTQTITNSTFSGNSSLYVGGIRQDDETLNLVNTIIANSINGDCSTQSAIGIHSNNLIEGGGNCAPSLTADPNLDFIANNGGLTQTFALLPGSPAINAGDDATCNASPVSGLDQRGVARPNGDHCDIGAYEYVDTSAPVVTDFVVNPFSNSFNIPILLFTASDDAALAGYLVTDDFTPPLVDAAGWTVSAPTTYTVAGDGVYTLYPWVKDAAGHVSAIYGSPVSVRVDVIAPTVISITRFPNHPSPTAKASLQFLVTFSEDVIGINKSDFYLTKSNSITGSSITSITGSGSTRIVTVNTGFGDGLLRLDIPVTSSILDPSGNLLTGLPYRDGDTYTINKTLVYAPIASQDGWILESRETSSIGGSFDKDSKTFNLGADAVRKQYRGILSFNTGNIPDDATITSIILKVRRKAVVGWGNPVTTFQGFMVDIKNGFFGPLPGLQKSDFQAPTSAVLGPIILAPTSTSSFYNFNLTNGQAAINKLSNNGGLTQIRLRFKLDDNNSTFANYLILYSGNAPVGFAPQLVVMYAVP